MTRSTSGLMRAVFPLRRAPSTVMSAFACDTSIRSRTESGAKPPKTTLCGAPIRAQASIATTTSGIIGMKIPTTSPLPHAEVLQPVGQALHVAMQVRVGDVAFLALLAAPVVGDALAEPGLDVAVQTVVGHVERPVGEPRDERGIRLVQAPW